MRKVVDQVASVVKIRAVTAKSVRKSEKMDLYTRFPHFSNIFGEIWYKMSPDNGSEQFLSFVNIGTITLVLAGFCVSYICFPIWAKMGYICPQTFEWL